MHDVAVGLRPQLNQRVQNYRGEMKRLNKEFVSVVLATCVVLR